MEIGEVKNRVIMECETCGGGIPFDPGSIEGETWQELADDLRELARHIALSANVLAGYAGYAQRRANEE